jgi:hypothetical protein
VRTLVLRAIRAKELVEQNRNTASSRLEQKAREEIPGLSSGRTLRGANSEIQQLYPYVCNICPSLNKVLHGSNADVIKSYGRALSSGVVLMEEAVTREADARAGSPRWMRA